MKSYQLELKEEDKKYLNYKNNKTFHIEIKYSGEKLTIEKEKFKNKEKSKLKKIEEIKNEMKFKIEKSILKKKKK